MKKLNNSRTLLLILIIAAASFAIQGCTPSAASAPAGQPTAPTNPENPVAAVQDTGIYKALTSLGFDISTEKVQAVDGQYQPKMGDITSLSYRQVDNATKYTYTYTLDRENSTEDNGVAQATCQMIVGANKSIYGPRGETFADIKIKLAE